mgnify:CR=1 FL=1|jgi:hypothetical protein
MLDRWIVCLKHGTKYSTDYVNRLYNMTKRHSTVPFGFACITEDPIGLHPDITHIQLPFIPALSGWWYKPWVFSNDLPLAGTIMFMDLDIVIVQNIDELWTYQPERFCIIRDFNRSTVKDWAKFNSSIFKFRKGDYKFVWDNLQLDFKQTSKMHGDQDWIFSQIKNNYAYWPDEWIMSYKWEIRDRNDIVKMNNKRVFKNTVEPTIDARTKILVFHGEPKPEDVQDPVVVQNWK